MAEVGPGLSVLAMGSVGIVGLDAPLVGGGGAVLTPLHVAIAVEGVEAIKVAAGGLGGGFGRIDVGAGFRGDRAQGLAALATGGAAAAHGVKDADGASGIFHGGFKQANGGSRVWVQEAGLRTINTWASEGALEIGRDPAIAAGHIGAATNDVHAVGDAGIVLEDGRGGSGLLGGGADLCGFDTDTGDVDITIGGKATPGFYAGREDVRHGGAVRTGGRASEDLQAFDVRHDG